MIKGIIFDLDGTLTDTIEDLTDAMNHGLRVLGCPPVSISQCSQMVGSGLKNFVSQALPEDRQELQGRLYDLMVEHYKDNSLNKTKAFEGMEDTLEKLHKRNIKLAVLTNKNQLPAEIIVHHIFGTNTFSHIVGAAEGRKVKPDPQTTLQIIKEWQLGREQVLYVGDSDIDVLTANAAGIKCAACLWGYRSREQLEAAGAELFIEHPRELLKLL